MEWRAAGRRLLELGPPLLVALWRVLALPPSLLWRDWVLVVALYWMAVPFLRSRRSEGAAAIVAAIILAGLYFHFHLEHALGTYGILVGDG
jgi:hypothetical protein